MQKINKTLSPLTGKGRGLRYAIIRKPLVCWMAESENLEVLSNSGGLSSAELNSDEAEEARHNGAARPKLVPIPILSHALSNIPAGFCCCIACVAVLVGGGKCQIYAFILFCYIGNALYGA